MPFSSTIERDRSPWSYGGACAPSSVNPDFSILIEMKAVQRFLKTTTMDFKWNWRESEEANETGNPSFEFRECQVLCYRGIYIYKANVSASFKRRSHSNAARACCERSAIGTLQQRRKVYVEGWRVLLYSRRTECSLPPPRRKEQNAPMHRLQPLPISKAASKLRIGRTTV